MNGQPTPEPLKIRGLPPSREYSFDEIGVGSAGARITSDALGRPAIYQFGVFAVFDGKNWTNLIDAADTNRTIGVVARATDGTTYYASSGVWGTIEFTGADHLTLRRQSAKVAPAWVSGENFHRIAFVADRVVFAGDSGIVLWDRTNARASFCRIRSLASVFQVGGKLFVSSYLDGLNEIGLETGELTQVNIREEIQAMEEPIEWDDGTVMALHARRHFVRFDGKQLLPWPTEIDAQLADGVSALCRLAGEFLAVAVRGRGLWILDHRGRVVHALDQQDFRMVSDLHSAESGLLWATTAAGVVKLHYASTVEVFDHRLGLSVSWPEVIADEGALYVVSASQVFQAMSATAAHASEFRTVATPAGAGVESVAATTHGLLMATNAGVDARAADGSFHPVLRGIGVCRLFVSDEDRSTCIAISASSIAAIRWTDGVGWKEIAPRIPGIGSPAVMVSARAGSVWLELGVDRIGHITLEDGALRAETLNSFPGKKGWIELGRVGRKISIRKLGRYQLYDEELGRMADAHSLSSLLQNTGLPSPATRPMSAPDGSIWLPFWGGLARMIPAPRGYILGKDAYPAIRQNSGIRILRDGQVWVSTGYMLHRVSPIDSPAPLRPARPRLAAIVDTRTNASIYNALADSAEPTGPIPYDRNNVSFRFHPSVFWPLRSLRYQYRLGNTEAAWSLPTTDPRVAFTNLYEGDYRLEVRLLDETTPLGEPLAIKFTVEPPVYRQGMALVAYMATFVLFLAGTIRYASARVRRANVELETLVHSRTRELNVANSRLQASVVEARDAAVAKGRFLANMSHEIRTPMNGVIGMADALAETRLDASQKEMIRIVRQSADSLLTIIDDVLDFSKIESGKLTVESVPLHLPQLASDTVALFLHRARRKHIFLRCESDPTLNGNHLGDPTRIRQIVSNLVSNAIKFTERGGVTVRLLPASEPPATVRIEVVDTGIGIPLEAQSKLFAPFSQADDSHTRRFGGTGLGLAIARQLVEIMHGSIGFDSRPNHGTTFWFQLPLEVTDRSPSANPFPPRALDVSDTSSPPFAVTPVTPAEPAAASVPAPSPLRLLIAEDNAINRTVARQLVERAGHKAEFAVNGRKALDQLAAAPAYDAILMDCQMPEMDGFEATQRIRRGEVPGLDPKIPIIALTAHAMPAAQERCLSAGMNDYLSKPIRLPALQAALARLRAPRDETPGTP